jgi:hypothetical protein
VIAKLLSHGQRSTRAGDCLRISRLIHPGVATTAEPCRTEPTSTDPETWEASGRGAVTGGNELRVIGRARRAGHSAFVPRSG